MQNLKDKQDIRKLCIDGNVIDTSKKPKLVADHINNFLLFGPNLASRIPTFVNGQITEAGS